MSSFRESKRAEAAPDHDTHVKQVMKNVVASKLPRDESASLRALPYRDADKEGFVISATKYQGRLEVMLDPMPGRYAVRCVGINSKGVEREVYFERDDVAIGELGGALDEAWNVGYEKVSGYRYNEHAADPPAPDSRHRRGRHSGSGRAPDDKVGPYDT